MERWHTIGNSLRTKYIERFFKLRTRIDNGPTLLKLSSMRHYVGEEVEKEW